MRTETTSRAPSHVARLAAIAGVLVPSLVYGQNTPGVEIDSAQSFVATMGPEGRTSRETNRVPLDPHVCYGWRFHFSKNTVGELALREEFELPAPGTWPASNEYEVRNGGRVAVTKSREKPTDGWITNEWCVGEGDPTGKYVITVYIQDRLAKSFEFLVAPRTREEDSLIAEVLGHTVRISQRFQMGEIILAALLDQYATERGIAPTADEVNALRARSFATSEVATSFMRSWKVRQALFRQYGGRVLLDQRDPQHHDPVPIDALRDFLRDHERRGSFRILSERLRPSFWNEYVNDSIYTFMTPEAAARVFEQPWWQESVPVVEGNPLSKLAGDWGLTVLVMGAGQFAGLTCGKGRGPGGPPVTLAASADGALGFAAPCNNGSEYSFRLRRDSATQAYLVSVKSKPGISVQDFPLAYHEGEGWQGKRDQQNDGATQSITAVIAPIEGRLWYGWMIVVLPTAGIGHEDDLKQPFLRADLTRAK